jgi:hypothetical protein
MANFQTHITVGVLTSGVLSTVAMAASLVNPRDALFLTVAGTIGSILPDIDLDYSRQSKTVFGGFGVFFAFVALFHYSQVLSIAELCVLWTAIYLLVRQLIWRMFNSLTMHRGVFHSFLASLTFAAAGVALFYHLLEKSDIVAWLGGALVLIGSLTHLLLDEIYSIDFGGNRVKRSFGTAMKFFNYENPLSAGLMAAALAGFLYLTPPSHNFVLMVKSPENWAYLQHRLLPKGKWFDLDELRAKLAAARQQEPATTSSVD